MLSPIAESSKLTSMSLWQHKYRELNMEVKFIGTVLVLVLKNERFVKIFIPILSQVIGTLKYSKILLL